MRTDTISSLVFAAVIAAGICAARADDCVNTAVNNPAFSSPYAADAKPCPLPATKLQQPASPDKTGAANSALPPKGSKTKTASAKPVTDPDHATVTNTPTGTLLKSGDTTVCISGSVSAVMAVGNGHRPSEPKLHDSSEPACN